MSDIRPRPETKREFMNKLVDPYPLARLGNPNNVYSETAKPGLPEFNRSYEISQKSGDKDINVSIGLEDMDSAIQYQFDNVLKLSVTQNGQRKKVPVIYGSPERWKSIQADGYFRDKENKIQVPLVIYRREDMTPVKDLGNKLDGNVVKNLVLAKRTYNKRNAYGNFCILTNRQEEKEFIVSFPPDYVNITYSCIIYTYFASQMNDIVEAVNFASDSYWGDPSKVMFRTRIENYTTAVNVEAGEDRMVKSEFKILLSGYMIPDSLNREVASVNRLYGPSQIALSMEMTERSENCKNCNRK